MAGLVRDDAGAPELLVLRRGLIQQQPRGVVEDRAGVLHAPELKRRHQQEIELAERVGDPGVAFEPFQRCGVQIEDRVAVARDLGGVGLAVEHAEPPAVAIRGLDLKAAGGEREEVGRQRLRFGKRQRQPIAAVLPGRFLARSRALPSPSECRG